MTAPYHKIHGIFKRHKEGPSRGCFIHGDWAKPELELLQDLEWEWTEKVDGTNIRIWKREDGSIHVGGRTDRANIPSRLLDTIAGMGLEDTLQSGLTLYGEGYGAGIQKGGGYGHEQRFILFDVRAGSYWLRRDAVNDLATELGCVAVPVVRSGTIQEAIEAVNYITWLGDEGCMSEGYVLRPPVQLFNRFGERIICKVKAADFR